MWINSRKTFAKSNEDRKNTARRWSLLSGKISEYLLPHNVLLTEYTVVEATGMLHSWAVWSSALHLKHQLTILIISWSDLISADNSDHQLDQSVYQLIRPYIRWSVEWTSWTITSCKSSTSFSPQLIIFGIFSTWVHTCIGPHKLMILNGANWKVVSDFSSVQFELKSLCKQKLNFWICKNLLRLQIKALSLHPDFWTFRCNCNRPPLFVYNIHNNGCIHTFVYI